MTRGKFSSSNPHNCDANLSYSISCRLPQTPRTPTTAAAHYFDDIFTKTKKPKKPFHLRRSSTSRSIGMRSDWETEGDGDETPPYNLIRNNSIGYLDEEALKRKAEVDEKVAQYVSDQLQRMRTHDSVSTNDDELEAHVNGSNGH